MDFRRLGLVATLATLLLLVAAIGTAGAHRAAFPSPVVITSGGPDGAEGRVKAKEDGCLEGRQVSLYFRDPASHKLVLVGTATTDSDGEWTIEVDLFAGTYVAKVSADTTTIHGMQHRCKPGRSGAKRL